MQDGTGPDPVLYPGRYTLSCLPLEQTAAAGGAMGAGAAMGSGTAIPAAVFEVR